MIRLFTCPNCKERSEDNGKRDLICIRCGTPLNENVCEIRYAKREPFTKCPRCDKTYEQPITECECGFGYETIDMTLEIIEYFKQKYEKEAQEAQCIPKCPTCSSANLKKISAGAKAKNTLAFGIFGTKRNKTFHCNNCGYEW